nr:hypothetical protein [uncultured Clostridium sp.]
MDYYNNCKYNAVKKSPVGILGRAIENKFVEQIETSPLKIEKCYGGMKACNAKSLLIAFQKLLLMQ